MRILLPVSLVLGMSIIGKAATIIGTLTASVISIDESSPGMAPSGISVGSDLIVTFAYESTAIADGNRGGYSGYPNNAEYASGLDLSITISGGGLSWDGFSSSSYALIMNNGGISGTSDRFDIEVRRSAGGVFSSFPGDAGGDCFLAFAMQDTIFPFDLTNSLDLPVSQLDFNLSEANSAAVAIYLTGVYSITAQPKLETLVIIPEPSSGILVAIFLSSRLVRRRRS